MGEKESQSRRLENGKVMWRRMEKNTEKKEGIEPMIKGLVERREKPDNIHYEPRNHGAKTKRPRNAKRKEEGEGERGLK